MLSSGCHLNGGTVARPRVADDFEAIRARIEELRLERDHSLAGQKLGSSVNGTDGEDRKDERRLPRSGLLRKLVR